MQTPLPQPRSATSVQPQAFAASTFLGRQPILDTKQRTFGNELLFRDSLENRYTGRSPENSSRQVIDHVLTLGLQTISPGAKIFLNCTREILTDGLVTVLPPESTVIELLETIEVDDSLVSACAALRKLGYHFALDDYVPSTQTDRLIEFASYAKLDFRACDSVALQRIQKHLSTTGIVLLAEKVETETEFLRATNEGYEYFQGYFFAKPEILQGRAIPANKMLYIRLLQAVSSSPCDRELIERLVMSETSLCFRLLRLVNSVGMGIRNPVRSIRQAMVMIGEDKIRKLITVASATALGKDMDRSPELILMALYRARFCELLASFAGQFAAEQYLIGLLSLMDAMLLVPTSEIVGMLPLAEETKAVLMGHTNQSALPLRILEAFETKNWKTCQALCAKVHLSDDRVAQLYVNSLHWASNQLREAGW